MEVFIVGVELDFRIASHRLLTVFLNEFDKDLVMEWLNSERNDFIDFLAQ